MRASVSSLLSLCLLLLAASACGDDPPDSGNSCAGVVCKRGQDCVAGVCVDRVEPEPEGCSTNEDCLFHPRGELCDRSSGLCVACFTTAHCPEGRTCQGGTCAGSLCTTNDDCGPDAPHCTEAGDACVACLDASHCEEGFTCEAGACTPVITVCETDADCGDEAPHCVAGGCVSCRNDGDCGALEICGSAGACEPVTCTDALGCAPWEVCVDHAACAPRACEELAGCPLGSLCEDGACSAPVVCGEDAPCLDPRAPHCDGGACKACVDNTHCGPWEQCREGSCAPFDTCSATADCKGGFVCVDRACVACAGDHHCPRGVCVAGACADSLPCDSAADCASGTCAGGVCVDCASDLDCALGSACEAGTCSCEGAACDPSGCVDDGFEPDAGPAAARPLALRSPAVRTLCPADEDWFVFTGAAGAAMRASLIQGQEGLEIALVWYADDAQRTRHERVGTAGTWMGLLPPAASSRYYVVVRSAGGAGDYTLLVEPQTGCTDAYEPNGTFATAAPIPTRTLVEDLRLCGPSDFFSFEWPAREALTAYVFFSGGNLDLQLFDGKGSRIPATAQPTGDRGGGVRLSLPAKADAETATLRVLAPGGATPPGSYALFVATERAAICGSDEELIPSGADRGRIQGSNLGVAASRSSACGSLQQVRTHRIHLTEPARLLVEVEAEFAPRLALFDDTCGGALACQSSGALDVASLPAGSYVLAVGSQGGAGRYDLSARLLPPVQAPANDRCAGAAALPLDGGPITGTTVGATADVATSCGGLSPDVFYSFDLPQQQRVVIDARGGEAAVSLFVTDATCAPIAGVCGIGHLDVPLGQGSYRLGVASPSGRGTSFTVEGMRITTPSNDTCAMALPITRGSTTWGDTTWAHGDQTYPVTQSCTGYLLDGNDVFHSIQLVGGVPVTITATPEQGYDLALYVMGDCTSRQCLAGVDAALAGGQEQLVFTPPSDGTYVIVVDGAHGGGAFSLQVD